MPIAKLLLVDDEPMLRLTLGKILEQNNFEVTTAANVTEAIKHISTENFDVLLSDLHMPNPGDGLTVVSAMRHANPRAVTMLFSAFPQMGAATDAILMQTDQILVKPMNVEALIGAIQQRLQVGAPEPRLVETVATILERTADVCIQRWIERVRQEDKLMEVDLTERVRAAHLPQVFRDLVTRLRTFKSLGSKELRSNSATQHGVDRRKQGYTAAMMVEESRMLQVSIFQTLQDNLSTIDFSVLLIGVMTIADEVDSQLSQAMESYIAESLRDPLPDLLPA